jgi:hypothetical protein
MLIIIARAVNPKITRRKIRAIERKILEFNAG